MTADDLTRLRAVVEAATPGPWTERLGESYSNIDAASRPEIAHVGSTRKDAEFIATFDPPTVAALIDRVERAERERDEKSDEFVRMESAWRRKCEALSGERPEPSRSLLVHKDVMDSLLASRDKAEAELAALRAAVKGLADDMGSIASGVETTLVAGVRFGKLRDVQRQLRRLLTEGADDGQ